MKGTILIFCALLFCGCDLMDMDLDLGGGTWGTEIPAIAINSMAEFSPSISINADQDNPSRLGFNMGAERIISEGQVQVQGITLNAMSGCMWECVVGYFGSVPWEKGDSLLVQVTFSDQSNESFWISVDLDVPQLLSKPTSLTSGTDLVVLFRPMTPTTDVTFGMYYNGENGFEAFHESLLPENLTSGSLTVAAARFQSPDFTPPDGSDISGSLTSFSKKSIRADNTQIPVSFRFSDRFEMNFSVPSSD